MDVWIDVMGDLCMQVVMLFVCFFEGYFWVVVDGNVLLFVYLGEVEVLFFGFFVGDEQYQVVSIVEGVGFFGGFGLLDDCIC